MFVKKKSRERSKKRWRNSVKNNMAKKNVINETTANGNEKKRKTL